MTSVIEASLCLTITNYKEKFHCNKNKFQTNFGEVHDLVEISSTNEENLSVKNLNF